MYVVKNSVRNILRNISRNILLGIVIMIIGIAAVVSLSINKAASDIIESNYESSNIEVSFSINRENMMSEFKGQMESGEISEEITSVSEGLTLEEIENYADSEYVEDTYIENTISMNSSNIEAATTENMISRENEKMFGSDEESSESDMGNMAMQGQSSQSGFSLVSGDFTVTGYNEFNAMEEFTDGTYVISEGAIFTDFESTDYVVVINEELASENELSVNDTITLTNPLNEEETFDFIIIGIFTDNSETEDTTSLFADSANTLITTVSIVDAVVDNSSDDYKIESTMTPTIILNSIDDLESYYAEVEEKGLSDTYQMSDNEDEILEGLEALENLMTFSNIFLIIVLLIGLIILVILNMINIRERKYEIGVLRAIGMKKKNVCIQFVLETFFVTVVAISFGIVIGTLLSVPCANYMLASEIESLESETEEISSNFGMESGEMQSGQMSGGMQMGSSSATLESRTDMSYVDSINASVDIVVVAQIFLIAILITSVSSCISIINISRYNPLKILSSRS